MLVVVAVESCSNSRCCFARVKGTRGVGAISAAAAAAANVVLPAPAPAPAAATAAAAAAAAERGGQPVCSSKGGGLLRRYKALGA